MPTKVKSLFPLLFAGLAAVAISASGAAAEPAACEDGPVRVGDTIQGTPCADVIKAPPGVAVVRGGGGDDTIVPAPITGQVPCPFDCLLGLGSQTFDGGPGDDFVFGQRGNDTLNGGEGNDLLYGGIGDDRLRGGPGDDRLSGGFGFDNIDGEADDDYVRGDGTIDRIFNSGGGNDTLSYTTGVTPGFSRTPAVVIPGFPTQAANERGVYLEPEAEVGDNGVAPFGGGVDEIEDGGFETLIGTPFADYIIGTESAETIFGGGGGDVILGEGGDDTLRGGADGDHLDGGPGNDDLGGEPASEDVVMRDTSEISAGFTSTEAPANTQLFLVGSSSAETVTARYQAGFPTTVTFEVEAGPALDLSPSTTAGCIADGTDTLTCTISAPLDSLLMAGMGGNDKLRTIGFPRRVSVVITGGNDDDILTGGIQTEDVLVDGDAAGSGADTLDAIDGDDALLHNAGPDERLGGDGNDLFLSDSICDDDVMNGGVGRDNASWTKFQDSGVHVNLETGVSGGPGSGATPSCGAETVDALELIEDLEGTVFGDSFYGGASENQLLGWDGADSFFAGANDDRIYANFADVDLAIDCGDGNDKTLIDRPPIIDPTPVGCEVVVEADPGTFRFPPEPLEPPPPAPSEPQAPVQRDTKPPTTKITHRPRKQVFTTHKRRRVVFTFVASESGARFRCKLDGKKFGGCRSPHAYELNPGKHAFRVFAIDEAGNSDQTPALFKFRISRR